MGEINDVVGGRNVLVVSVGGGGGRRVGWGVGRGGGCHRRGTRLRADLN